MKIKLSLETLEQREVPAGITTNDNNDIPAPVPPWTPYIPPVMEPVPLDHHHKHKRR